MINLRFKEGFDLKEGEKVKRSDGKVKNKNPLKKTLFKEKYIKEVVQNIKDRNSVDKYEKETDYIYENIKKVEISASLSAGRGLGKQFRTLERKTFNSLQKSYQKRRYIKSISLIGEKKTIKPNKIRRKKRALAIKNSITHYLVIAISALALLICLFVSILSGAVNNVEMEGGQDNITSAYLYLGQLESRKGTLTSRGMSIKAEPIMAYFIAEFGMQKNFNENQKSQLVKIYDLINTSGYRNNTNGFFDKFNETVFSSKTKYNVYQKLMKEGIYTQFKTLGSPFIGKEWTNKITSAWGWRYHPIAGGLKLHRGLDIGMPSGTPVNSVCSGKITSAGWNGSYGNCVMVRYQHDETDITVLYAHLSSISVKKGASIKDGTIIGRVGSTGNSTGPHLHIELIDGGYSGDITKLYYPRIYLKETKE